MYEQRVKVHARVKHGKAIPDTVKYPDGSPVFKKITDPKRYNAFSVKCLYSLESYRDAFIAERQVRRERSVDHNLYQSTGIE